MHRSDVSDRCIGRTLRSGVVNVNRRPWHDRDHRSHVAAAPRLRAPPPGPAPGARAGADRAGHRRPVAPRSGGGRHRPPRRPLPAGHRRGGGRCGPQRRRRAGRRADLSGADRRHRGGGHRAGPQPLLHRTPHHRRGRRGRGRRPDAATARRPRRRGGRRHGYPAARPHLPDRRRQRLRVPDRALPGAAARQAGAGHRDAAARRARRGPAPQRDRPRARPLHRRRHPPRRDHLPGVGLDRADRRAPGWRVRRRPVRGLWPLLLAGHQRDPPPAGGGRRSRRRPGGRSRRHRRRPAGGARGR